MSQTFNPYLPATEYIPDGEPYVFGDRVYLYGSHDRFNAPIFCTEDYVCWSAPLTNLSDWRYEGVVYHKNQDPKNRWGLHLLFAPDVAVGADGRYYLYYALDFMGIMSVAVCDTPAGSYTYYGDVHYRNGTIWGRRKGNQFPFDPGVLRDDDGKIYLYSGFATKVPAVATGGIHLKNDGGCVLELEEDMITVKTDEKIIFPMEGKAYLAEDCNAASFAGHEFFEASSIRKIDGKYYFVYSSKNNHELCYAVSDRPNGGFMFGGTLVDQGDLYLEHQQEGNAIAENSENDQSDNAIAENSENDQSDNLIAVNTDEAHANNYLGNTHGGMAEINGRWYISYHRQTNRHSYSRQACMEKLERTPDGRFLQAEVTSCGLNAETLKDSGIYEARIACNLWSKTGTGRYDCANPRMVFAAHPYITQDRKEQYQYVANMRDGAVCGFKYFGFEKDGKHVISITVRGRAKGRIEISTDPVFATVCTQIPMDIMSAKWITLSAAGIIPSGKQPLYFRYRGTGKVDFRSFELGKK